MCFIDMSSCQRFVFPAAEAPLSSRAASPTASPIMPRDFTMPMIPAMAIPPMPIIRAYSLKISWGQALADKTKFVLSCNTSAAVLGLGYIVGLKYAFVMPNSELRNISRKFTVISGCVA